MSARRLVWHLYPSYLLITLTALVAIGFYAISELRDFHLDNMASTLASRSRLVAQRIKALDLVKDAGEINLICKQAGEASLSRITVVGYDGTVLGDTDKDPDDMDNHYDRPEIAQARKGAVGRSIRWSNTLNRSMMYIAVPLRHDGRIDAFVRTSVDLLDIEKVLWSSYKHIAIGGILVALIAAGVCFAVSRSISRPLEEMRRGAERFARGELARKLSVPQVEEFAALGRSMNEMAYQLDNRIRLMTEQRNTQEAVFRSMSEGVLAIDSNARILKMNSAAENLLEVSIKNATGRLLQEVARNNELEELAAAALSGQDKVEGSIVLYGSEERHIQVRSTVLRDAEDGKLGALIVLNEVTRLQKLESIRRDFVANVSHELRTPITSIQGFAETLLDNPEEKDPARLRHFLEIILRQSKRLSAIIKDLLALSRIERETEHDTVELNPGAIRPVLEGAIETCRLQARDKNITMELECADELSAAINAQLLEQAVTNLLDNALKYCNDNSVIEIRCRQENDSLVIAVKDNGPGIPEESLPRLFERFYRVDKARSRKLGGTGLGLAIVKHITLAHGGQARVKSRIGEGSTFTISLPTLKALNPLG